MTLYYNNITKPKIKYQYKEKIYKAKGYKLAATTSKDIKDISKSKTKEKKIFDTKVKIDFIKPRKKVESEKLYFLLILSFANSFLISFNVFSDFKRG